LPEQSREVAPGPDARSVRTKQGLVLQVPESWILVAPGDPGLTRRLKKAGPTWTVKEKRGRRLFSRGVWTEASVVQRIRLQLAEERSDPAYERKLEAGRRRREAAQERYAEEFRLAVESYLDFAPVYERLAKGIAYAITEQTIEVGSGTVARTERIPLERRVEAATIAWLRHQTTEYDDLVIPRVKGMRREVRRQLAERSRRLLGRYRRGEAVDWEECPLSMALLP
jgi:hypothetical protein